MGMIKYYHPTPELFYSLLSCVNCHTVDTWSKLEEGKFQCTKCNCEMGINDLIDHEYILNKPAREEL